MCSLNDVEARTRDSAAFFRPQYTLYPKEELEKNFCIFIESAFRMFGSEGYRSIRV
jgi:hypothetical protein